MGKTKKPPRSTMLRLRIVDRGRTRGPILLRDVYFEEGDTGSELWLHHVDAAVTLADDVAAFLVQAGVEVVRCDQPLPFASAKALF